MPRSEPVFAWLLTYAVHSTLLLGLAWALTRRLVQSHGARDLIWKTALLGGLIVAGVGIGMINPPLAATAVGVVPPQRAGMGSGGVAVRSAGASNLQAGSSSLPGRAKKDGHFWAVQMSSRLPTVPELCPRPCPTTRSCVPGDRR